MDSIPLPLLRYAHSPRMPSDTAGKRGAVRLGFEIDQGGRCILRDLQRHAPLIVQQELYFDSAWPELPCVYILSSGGPNVEGDRYHHDIRLARDAYAHISTGAATKLASMQRNFSSLQQSISLAKGAYLEYLPEPTIPCRNTRYMADIDITIDSEATLFHSEIFLSGRKHYGEHFDYDIMHLSTRVRNNEQHELYSDRMLIEPNSQSIERRGVMGGYDIFATALILTPRASAEAIYAEAAPMLSRHQRCLSGITHLPNGCGLIARILGDESHLVKETIRNLCGIVRQKVKGYAMPRDFVWR